MDELRKIYLSDLHIGDGTVRDDFEFDRELVVLLEKASADGVSEIVFVGDTLELVASSEVKSHGLVPYTALVKKISPSLILRIAERHADVFEALRHFTSTGKLTFVVGNHDYYLLHSKQLAEALITAIDGEKGSVSIVPYQLDKVSRIFAIHGNQYDAVNKFSIDKRSGDLLGPLGGFLERYMMIHFDDVLTEKNVPLEVIQNYHKVHPMLDLFMWFEYIRRFYDIGVNLPELWTRAILDMMDTPFVRSWLRSNYLRLRFASSIFVQGPGGMKLGEWIMRVFMAFRRLKRTDYLLQMGQKILGARGEKGFRRAMDPKYYAEHGGTAPAIVPTELNGVVMGHNHRHALRIIPSGGEYCFYANTGTWRPVIELIDKNLSVVFERRTELFYLVVSCYNGELDVETNNVRKLSDRQFRVSQGTRKQQEEKMLVSV